MQPPDPEPNPEQPVLRPLPAMPWEDRSRSWPARFVGTLGNALAPVRGVPALCNGRRLPAWTFALISALPFMLLWGIAPFTHTLVFTPPFRIEPTAAAASVPLWLDLGYAMAVGLGMSMSFQLAWALPFLSLLKAFADARVPQPLVTTTAMRFILYRAWLVPFGLMAIQFIPWAIPEPVPEAVAVTAVLVFRFVPRVLVLLSAQATAAAFGASGLGALAVAVVPAIMQEVVGLTVGHYAALLLPEMPPPTP